MADLRLAFLGAASLFVSSESAPPAQTAVAVVIQPTVEIIPPQKERVEKEVGHFQKDFARRVQRNDRSDPWDACFSVGIGLSRVPYKQAYVSNLRFAALATRNSEQASTGTDKSNASSIALSSQSSENANWTAENKPIVILDPGHGSEGGIHHDTGAMGKNYNEVKTIDSISARLTAELESRGMIVVRTREAVDGNELSLKRSNAIFAGQSTALEYRAGLANHLHAAFPQTPKIFLSIHGNTGGGSGPEIFYYAPVRNAVTDSIASKELAHDIKNHFRLRANTPTRVMGDDYAVNRCTNPEIAAVLTEVGFIDNPEDRAALKNADAVAKGIADGVSAFFKRREPAMPADVQVAMNIK